MIEATNKYQSIFGYGTTQKSRLPKALLPDALQIDGRDLPQMMAYSSQYARLLRFFNEENVHEGDWSDFLQADVSFILADMVSLDLDLINDGFANLVDELLHAHQIAEKSILLEQVFGYIQNLLLKFNGWYQQIHAISLPNSDLEYQIELELYSIITSQLRRDLQQLKAYDLGAEPTEALGAPIGLKYEAFDPVWELESVKPENIYKGDQTTDKISSSLVKLRLLYRSVYNGLSYASHNFRPFFEKSIYHKNNHKPDTGLLIAFLQLLNYAKADLNRVSHQYLQFYYEHHLQLRQLPAIPDEVHVNMELSSHLDRHIIPAGTPLLAGQDEAGKDILYETTHELEINQAKLESLRTVFFSKYNQPNATSYEVVTNVYAAPIANSRDGAGDSFSEEHASWPTFGEEQALKPAGGYTMQKASIGFAIASPILAMHEGDRKVRMTLHLDPDSIHIFKKLLLDMQGQLKEKYEQSRNQGLSLQETFITELFHTNSDNRNISIELTGNRGWIKVDSTSIKVQATGAGDWPDVRDEETADLEFSVLQAFTIEFTVPASKPAIVPFDARVIRDGQYDSPHPIVKILLTDTVSPYLYTFFRELKLQRVDIDVEVQGVRQLKVYNDMGVLDPKQPYQPFGPQPMVGSSFIFGNKELFSKDLTEMDVHIEWLNMPKTVEAFERHYAQYGKSFTPAAYKVALTGLSNNQFLPVEAPESLTFPLYKISEGVQQLGRSHLHLGNDQLLHLQLQPNYELSGTNDYSTETETGYFKLELRAPEEAFGHQAYPKAFTSIVTRNAQNPEEADEPVPNDPYTPLIRSVKINYKAETTLVPGSDAGGKAEQIFHVHPFGIVDVSLDRDKEGYYLLPQYKADGYLYIGLRDVKAHQTLSLFFELTSRSSKTGSVFSMPKIEWSYLSRNRWMSFSDRQLLMDTTDQFTKSGIIQLFTPRSVPTVHSQLPAGLFWIRASVKGNLEVLCHTLDVRLQAMHLRWASGGSTERLREPLPPLSIDRFQDRRAAITSIQQPFESFGGKAAEDTLDFFSRVSERLRHKGRAITLWDFERLVLERFHTIFQVKALSKLNVLKEQLREESETGDGVLLVVVPKRRKYIKDETPKANYKFLMEVERYLSDLIAPFVSVNVRNPQYEYLRIVAKVKFENNDGRSYQRLLQDIRQFIAPWLSDFNAPLNIGAKIDEGIVLNYIKSLDYVRFITKFSILRIVEHEDGKFQIDDTASEKGAYTVLHASPWGVFLPDEDHQIEMVEVEEEEEPEKVTPPIRFQNRIDIYKEHQKEIRIKERIRSSQQPADESDKGDYSLVIKL